MNKLKQLINPKSDDEIQKGLKEMVGLMGEFTLDTTLLSQDALDVIFGTQKPSEEQEFSMQFEYEYQARKHKKKRINKKWLKRYGYKKRKITSDGWVSVRDPKGNIVEFIKGEQT